MNNPFIISFGKKPSQYISRINLSEEIIEDFNSDNPSSQAYMLVGVRGVGKTVMLSSISKTLKEQPGWIVMELNSTRDLLESFAAKLYALPEMNSLFIEAKLDLSLLGIGISIDKGIKISDIEQAITSMLEITTKKNKKILITIDEVTVNQYMREFASAFQIFIRNEFPLFMIMSGLFDNINSLQNDKSLTFLYRTPKIALSALNISAIVNTYQRVFSAKAEDAKYMAQLTNGYPFAFQVLGHLVWKYREENPDYNVKEICDEVLNEYDQILQEYVYEKIWNEMSAKEREIVACVCKEDSIKVKTIRDILGYDSNSFTVYRNRLIKKGILTSTGYGTLSVFLPRFDAFVVNMF